MNKFKLLFAAACLCLAWFNPAVAEEKSEGVGVLIKITAKDGHDKALIQGITDYHKWVANFDGHMRFNWWKAVTGPDTGVYYAYSGNHDWADFDADYDWEEKSNEVLEANVMPHIADMHRMMVVDMDEVEPIDRQLLMERHLISKQHAEGQGCRGAVIAANENRTVMINEEDHLRIQCLRSGMQLDALWKEIDGIDDLLWRHIGTDARVVLWLMDGYTRTLAFSYVATPFKPMWKGWRAVGATEDGTFVE